MQTIRTAAASLSSMASAALHSMDETGLIRQTLRGDRAAFRQIVESHKEQVFRVALGLTRNHHDAEDVVQEVFLRAYTSLGGFRAESRLRAWLCRITVNTARDAGRRRVARRGDVTRSLDDSELTLAMQHPDGDPERLAEALEIRRDVDRAVLALSESERAVFVLRHDAQLSIREIAVSLDRAEGTVKNLLFRAVRKMRRHLVQHLDGPKGGES